MAREIYRGPERLTRQQERLAELLFDTKTEAPVTRRRDLPGGEEVEFYKITRPLSPIAFAQEGEFVLKSHEKNRRAPLSPIYFSLRNLDEELVDQIGIVLAEIPSRTKPDVCAGIPAAGIPLAEAYARHAHIPVIDIFSKEQTEAGRRIIPGKLNEFYGRRLRIVDDLVTKGDTKFEALHAAEGLGYEVFDLMVVVDRQQGATKQLKQAGYRLRAAFTMDQVLRFGVRTDRVTPEQYQQVANYLRPQK